MNIATGREARPTELDTKAEVFAVAGEKQEMVADEATIALLKRFAVNPDIEKAKAEFERAQEIEEKFHKDFDGVDFTGDFLQAHDKSENTSDGRLSSVVKGVPLFCLYRLLQSGSREDVLFVARAFLRSSSTMLFAIECSSR